VHLGLLLGHKEPSVLLGLERDHKEPTVNQDHTQKIWTGASEVLRFYEPFHLVEERTMMIVVNDYSFLHSGPFQNRWATKDAYQEQKNCLGHVSLLCGSPYQFQGRYGRGGGRTLGLRTGCLVASC